MGVIRFSLHGRIPSKKNRLASAGPGRRFFLPSEIRRASDSLALQIISQLPREKPYRHLPREAEIEIQLRVSTARQDRDGMVTTILDALVDAGVIRDDSVSRWNGRLTVAPAEVDPANPGATITVRCPDESVDESGRVCLCLAKSTGLE